MENFTNSVQDKNIVINIYSSNVVLWTILGVVLGLIVGWVVWKIRRLCMVKRNCQGLDNGNIEQVEVGQGRRTQTFSPDSDLECERTNTVENISRNIVVAADFHNIEGTSNYSGENIDEYIEEDSHNDILNLSFVLPPPPNFTPPPIPGTSYEDYWPCNDSDYEGGDEEEHIYNVLEDYVQDNKE